MAEHYTRNTVEASAWCPKCQKRTMHRVDGVKLGPCLACIAKLEAARPTADDRKPTIAAQGGLFK